MTSDEQVQAWTPEPWSADAGYVFGQVPGGRPNGEGIARCHGSAGARNGEHTQENDYANAARIVACVNALAGVEDPAAFVEAVQGVMARIDTTYAGPCMMIERELAEAQILAEQRGRDIGVPDPAAFVAAVQRLEAIAAKAAHDRLRALLGEKP